MTIEKIDLDLCTGCGICIDSCPMDVIRMDRAGQKAVIRYPQECMNCEQCALDCPEEAVTVTPYKTVPLISSWG